MILIDNRDDLIKNLDTVESYLNGDNDEMVEIMAELIRKGKNFVAYDFNGSTHFAPSRFVGYKDNTIKKHFQKDNGKHGTYTSQRLRRSDILGTDRIDPMLQAEWERYCRECGVEPTQGKKTFWRLSNYEVKVTSINEFAEGKRYYTRHLAYERNHKAIQQAKENYLIQHGSVCQICGFDFYATYGEVGLNYIEAHHTKPVSEMKEGDVTHVKDLAMVCANCHRMLHRRKPLLNPKDLKKLLK